MWTFSYLGIGAPSPLDAWWVLVLLLVFVSLFGATGWMVSALTSGQVAPRRSLTLRLRIALPASGLAVSIIGATLSLTYSAPYGAILAAVGLFTFLAGLALAAAIPPE